MKTPLLLASVLAAVLPRAGAAQELLQSSGGTQYDAVQIAPSKSEILAIAHVPTGEPAPVGAVPYVTSVHFYDRKSKARSELTPAKGSVFGQSGDSCQANSIAFWPDGREFVAGGWGFFAGWRNPDQKNVFFHRGDPDGFLEMLEINQFAASRKGARVAYVSTRRLDDLSRESTEIKLTLWDRGVSKADVVTVRVNKLLRAPAAKLSASISGDGDFLACYHRDAKKLTVHDASKVEIKKHAQFELNLPDVAMFPGHPAMRFASDNGALWVLCKGKLYSFDLKAKKQGKTIEFTTEPFWIHALADGSSLIFGEIDHNGKENATVLSFFDPNSLKAQGKINLGKAVAPLAISPDDTLLAGCGRPDGIFLWDLPELLAKKKRNE